jgi:hypothetical protein
LVLQALQVLEPLNVVWANADAILRIYLFGFVGAAGV